MQNQDPLSPMDNAQVTSQMAQINTVSGIEKLNRTVQGLSSQFVQLQAVQGASLVGHDVVVPATSSHDRRRRRRRRAASSSTGAADAVKVEILEPSGAVVDTLQPRRAERRRAQLRLAGGQRDDAASGLTLPGHRDQRRRRRDGDAADARPRRRGQHRGNTLQPRARAARARSPYSAVKAFN